MMWEIWKVILTKNIYGHERVPCFWSWRFKQIGPKQGPHLIFQGEQHPSFGKSKKFIWNIKRNGKVFT